MPSRATFLVSSKRSSLTASATAAAGFDWRMGRSNYSIRGEVRARHTFASCSSSDCRDFTDFIYTVGVSYRFGGSRSMPAPEADTDLDGVLDMWDECPNTPRGTEVSASGCPIMPREADSDGDRIPDSRDDCPNTPAGTAVNPQGCSLDSDMDGVLTGQDRCPGSRPGAQVDEFLEQHLVVDALVVAAPQQHWHRPGCAPSASWPPWPPPGRTASLHQQGRTVRFQLSGAL